jgi:predicted membrane protein
VSGGTRLYLSVLLIIAGLLLFLGNLGLFPLHNIWQLWPLVLVAIGAGRLTDHRGLGDQVWSVAMIVFGAVFFCISMGWLHLRAHDGSWPLAIGLIAFGIIALTKRLEPPRMPHPPRPSTSYSGEASAWDMADFLTDTAVLTSVQRRVESTDLRGGTLTCVMGSIELDLRRVQIQNPSQPLTIETTCVMGSIKLRIPDTWRVSIVGASVMGVYEDKTMPIARPDAVTGTLVITGSSVMGQVEIDS